MYRCRSSTAWVHVIVVIFIGTVYMHVHVYYLVSMNRVLAKMDCLGAVLVTQFAHHLGWFKGRCLVHY